MDNVKIGCFTAECRKEKQITQQQLADKLNITNKAVSKWEAGNGFPDISLLAELAGILDVSVDEILRAEKNQKVIPMKDDVDTVTMNEKVMNPNAAAVLYYMVHKSIIKFKIMSLISIILSIGGIGIQYFIWRETKDLSGWLFGLWLEICSGGIYFYFRTIMRNQIRDYNAAADNILNVRDNSKQFMNCLLILWGLMPLILILYFI